MSKSFLISLFIHTILILGIFIVFKEQKSNHSLVEPPVKKISLTQIKIKKEKPKALVKPTPKPPLKIVKKVKTTSKPQIKPLKKIKKSHLIKKKPLITKKSTKKIRVKPKKVVVKKRLKPKKILKKRKKTLSKLSSKSKKILKKASTKKVIKKTLLKKKNKKSTQTLKASKKIAKKKQKKANKKRAKKTLKPSFKRAKRAKSFKRKIRKTPSKPKRDNYLAINKNLIYQAIQRAKYYPAIAKRLNLQGVVRVRFTINPNGSVSNITTSNAPSILQNAAKKSIIKASGEFPRPKERVNVSLALSYKLF